MTTHRPLSLQWNSPPVSALCRCFLRPWLWPVKYSSTSLATRLSRGTTFSPDRVFGSRASNLLPRSLRTTRKRLVTSEYPAIHTMLFLKCRDGVNVAHTLLNIRNGLHNLTRRMITYSRTFTDVSSRFSLLIFIDKKLGQSLLSLPPLYLDVFVVSMQIHKKVKEAKFDIVIVCFFIYIC